MRKRRLLGIDISHITIIQSNVPGILDDISGLCSGAGRVHRQAGEKHGK